MRVAASDSGGTLVNPNGLDVARLIQLTSTGRSVTACGEGEKLGREAIGEADCDIWNPAARPDVLHAGNAECVCARLVAPGANIPATAEAEAILHKRGAGYPVGPPHSSSSRRALRGAWPSAVLSK